MAGTIEMGNGTGTSGPGEAAAAAALGPMALP